MGLKDIVGDTTPMFFYDNRGKRPEYEGGSPGSWVDWIGPVIIGSSMGLSGFYAHSNDLDNVQTAGILLAGGFVGSLIAAGHYFATHRRH